jgi:hypothetical protein
MSFASDCKLEIVKGPLFHPNPAVDVAGFSVHGMSPGAHYVPLGGHLDDWIGVGDFELSRALVLGYPPIPFAREPTLVAATGEVNAVVDLDMGGATQVHFILSAVPRGGFSGGLAFSEWGFALGVISGSLVHNSAAAETGFFATTSVEAIYVCLAHNGLLPPCQAEAWDGPCDA